MRLHSNIHTPSTIHAALERAQESGKVAAHVAFEVLASHRSMKRARAYEIKLGTYVKIRGDKRTFLNSGTHGADSDAGVYSATYDEWGWFIAELFAADPDGIFGTYSGRDGFIAATDGKYRVELAGA